MWTFFYNLSIFGLAIETGTASWVDESGNFITDESGNPLVFKKVA